MSREICLRAWNQDTQEFERFVFSKNGHYTHTKLAPDSTNAIKEWQLYTGLKDKNGVEIYEGDVVTWNQYGEKHQVFFAHGCFQITHHPDTADEPFLGLDFSECEVIGDIYEGRQLTEREADNGK